MKKISFVVFFSMFLLSCVGDKAVSIDFYNNSNKEVRHLFFISNTASLYNQEYYGGTYPDTTLPKNWKFSPIDDRIGANQRLHCLAQYSGDSWEPVFENAHADTISLFILDSKIVDSLPWNEIRDNYLILQRYDIVASDFNKIWHVSFPPDSTMKHIKMWPPYGTYDENGNMKQRPSTMTMTNKR